MSVSLLAATPIFVLAMMTGTCHSFVCSSRRSASIFRTAPTFMVREVDIFSPRRPPTDDEESGRRPADVVPDDYDLTDDYEDSDEDWTPDRDKIRAAREWSKRAEADVAPSTQNGSADKARRDHSPIEDSTSVTLDDGDEYFQGGAGSSRGTSSPNVKKAKSPFTEEEEEIIEAMGGKSMENPSPKRESGFLGDSTLREIAADFQMPVCYLADVLCSWSVPVPIDVDTRLGDMVTGEMAFSLVEAVHSLDAGELNDRYSSFDLMGLCFEYDIDLKDAFDYCVKEGWNLPFGVRTFLRVDQEDELVRSLSDDLMF